MADIIYSFTRNPTLPLYMQVREVLIQAIDEGYLPPHHKIPSSRILAHNFNISRNIIIMALQQLVDDGYLVVKNRSGYFVHDNYHITEAPPRQKKTNRPKTPSAIAWNQKINLHVPEHMAIYRPKNWEQYQYPFIYGQIPPSILPLQQWQECTRLAIMKTNTPAFTTDRYGYDDTILQEMIRTRLLPKRQIKASNDEILVTMGAQNAIYLIAQLLGGIGKNIVMEDPCYCDARHTFIASQSSLHYAPIDNEGMLTTPINDTTDIIYTTPTLQSPTNISMSPLRKQQLLKKAKQHDALIIEDDYDCQLIQQVTHKTPLKTDDVEGRVLYVGSLSKAIFPGIRVGYIVADKAIIDKLRTLRALMMRHPPHNNQHAVGLFISLGYYQQWIKKYHQILAEKRHIVQQCLQQYPIGTYHHQIDEGASIWLNLPPYIDIIDLRNNLLQQNVIIEAGTHFYQNSDDGLHHMRLGFSYIDTAKIEAGIKVIYETINALHK